MAAFRPHRRTRLVLSGLTVAVLAVGTATLLGWPSRPSLRLADRPVAATHRPPHCGTSVQLAFGGDVNTANAAGRVLTDGLGAAATVLRRADLAMVNTETVFADDRSGLVRQPKAYNFLAPTRLLDVLEHAGVDVVTVANNHGLDYGPAGLARTLAARTPARPLMVGAGADISAAFAPARRTVRGRGVVLFAATDVIDDGLDWAATDHRPGLASIKTATGLARLRSAVRADRRAHPCDVIAVYLHAGVELSVCPTARQRVLATDLARDGANAVLMSHAHVVEPGRVSGSTAIDYGLGNLVFDAQSATTARTGVLTVEVPGSGPPTETWHPGRIVDGLPTMLSGAAATTAAQRWRALSSGCAAGR